MAESIKKLSQLLADLLGPTRRISSEKITRLTAPGDNYGSLMLNLDLVVVDDDTAEEELVQLVAKKIPAAEVFQEIFDIQVTFRKEVAFYRDVIPALQSFQREMRRTEVINCFPRSLGARYNLDNSDLVDENAVLVLENLVAAGFSTTDRLKGFDFESSKAVLRDLAEFHSASLGLKLKQPDYFDAKIKKHCRDYNFDHDTERIFRECAKDILLESKTCEDVAHRVKYLGEVPRPAPREPFATLIHFDLWTNNTMQKLVDGKILNKFVDFQLYTYGSPAADLFFFLWSSVQQEVMGEHLDELIEYYHEVFIQGLEGLQCDTAPFSFENLMEEIKIEARFEFGHALSFSTFIVSAKRPTGGTENDNIPRTKEELIQRVSLEVKKKAWFMTEECRRRQWLGLL